MFKSLRERLSSFKDKLSRKVEEEMESAPETAPGEASVPTRAAAQTAPAKPAPVAPRPEGRAARRASRRAGHGVEAQATAPAVEPEAAFTDSVMGRMLRENKLDDLLEDLETILLESDVALPVADAIKEELKRELVGRRIRRDVDMADFVEDALRQAIRKVLAVEPVDLDAFVESHPKPVVLMFVGVNGTGKTTTIARIAHRLKKKGLSIVLAAGDTFRAGAIEQVEVHGERLGVKVIKHQAGADPAAVAYDAVEHARARNKDVVLIDTAGRMQTNTNLMDEMKKIKRIAKPDLVIFVGDALAGNDAVEQARAFEAAVGIDMAILTKIDADAKGGAALSIAHAVGRPIAFVGIGQGYDDLQVFDPDWMVERLFSS
jgi:fused signal recognition particle receptor